MDLTTIFSLFLPFSKHLPGQTVDPPKRILENMLEWVDQWIPGTLPIDMGGIILSYNKVTRKSVPENQSS